MDAFHELFGWRSQDVFRAGIAYEMNPQWPVRTGYSNSRRQFGFEYAVQNALLVEINPNAATFGVTRTFQDGGEFTLGYEYALNDSVTGSGPSEGMKISTKMGFVTVVYGWKF